jgi:3-hydroxybutyryl-CoA dehydrogenase
MTRAPRSAHREDESKVAILGAGLMGAQIGLEYAIGGYPVVLVTRSAASQAAAVERVQSAAGLLVRSRLLRAAERTRALDRISLVTDVTSAAEGASIVVESVGEDVDLKVDVLGRAARAAPSAILASNTSALSITEIGRAIGAEDRFLGTHYWNPPTLMPLVELVAGAGTDPSRMIAMRETLERLGKRPLEVQDVTGFVWNRLMLALIREAVAMVSNGTASPGLIDEIAVRGFGRRWSLIGPFASMAAGGPGTVAAVADLIFPTLASDVTGGDILALDLPVDANVAATITRRNRALGRQLLEERQRKELD